MIEKKYTVIIPNSVKKDIKKLDNQMVKEIINALEKIAVNPYKGLLLTGNLKNVRKVEVRKTGIQFRIVYKIIESRIEIHIIHIGSRENFYRELKRRI